MDQITMLPDAPKAARTVVSTQANHFNWEDMRERQAELAGTATIQAATVGDARPNGVTLLDSIKAD